MPLFNSPLGTDNHFSDTRKYVKDFEIVEVLDDRGRMRRRALYKGNWFILRDWDNALIYLLVILAFSLITVGLYVWMLLLTHLVSGQLWVMIPLLAGALPCLYLLMGALSLPLKGKPMRRDQYMHSLIRVSRSATAMIVFVVIGSVAALIFRAIHGDWSYFREDRLFTILCAAIVGACGIIIALQRAIGIAERENSFFPQHYL